MSSIADSRKPGGIGILPLRHRDFDKDTPKWDLDMRSSILAVEITGRFDDWPGIGAWLYDQDKVGDLNGAQVWKKKTRECSMWRFATPVRTLGRGDTQTLSGGGHGTPTVGGEPIASVDTKGVGQTTTTTTGKASHCGVFNDQKMIPILNKDWAQDTRLEDQKFTRPKTSSNKDLWPKFPVDWFGISLPADKEQQQEDLFMPTDPRIAAPNVAGDPAMGTMVCDLDTSFAVDPDRMEHVQAFWRVIKKPVGCVSFLGRNSIAWNIGLSGCEDLRGGLVIDDSGSNSSGPATSGGKAAAFDPVAGVAGGGGGGSSIGVGSRSASGIPGSGPFVTTNNSGAFFGPGGVIGNFFIQGVNPITSGPPGPTTGAAGGAFGNERIQGITPQDSVREIAPRATITGSSP